MLLAAIEYDGVLSIKAYVTLIGIITIVIGGLGWAFYKAISAAGNVDETEQLPDEV